MFNIGILKPGSIVLPRKQESNHNSQKIGSSKEVASENHAQLRQKSYPILFTLPKWSNLYWISDENAFGAVHTYNAAYIREFFPPDFFFLYFDRRMSACIGGTNERMRVSCAS